MKNFKTSTWYGIILGVSIPIVGAALSMMIFEQLAKINFVPMTGGEFSINQQRTIWVIGIIFNIIPFQYFKFRKEEKVMRGLLFATIAAVVIWMVFYFRTIF